MSSYCAAEVIRGPSPPVSWHSSLPEPAALLKYSKPVQLAMEVRGLVLLKYSKPAQSAS